MRHRMSIKQWSEQDKDIKKLFVEQWTGLTESGETVSTDEIGFRSEIKLQWNIKGEIKKATVSSRTVAIERQAETIKKKRNGTYGRRARSVAEYCKAYPSIGNVVYERWVGEDENGNAISMDELPYLSENKVLWKTKTGKIKAATAFGIIKTIRDNQDKDANIAHDVFKSLSDNTQKIKTFPMYINNTNYFVVASLRKDKYSSAFAYIIYCTDLATDASNGEYTIVTKETYDILINKKIVHKISDVETICIENDTLYNKIISSEYIGEITEESVKKRGMTFDVVNELLSNYRISYDIMENDPDKVYNLTKIYYKYINGVKRPIAYGLIDKLGNEIVLSRNSTFTIVSRHQVSNAKVVDSNISINNNEPILHYYINKLNKDEKGCIHICTFSAEKGHNFGYTSFDVKKASGKTTKELMQYRDAIIKRKSNNANGYNIVSTFNNIVLNSSQYSNNEVTFAKEVIDKCKRVAENLFVEYNIVKDINNPDKYVITEVEVDKYGVLNRANIVNINTNKIATVDITDIFSDKCKCKLAYKINSRLKSEIKSLISNQDLKLHGINVDMGDNMVMTIGPYTDPILLSHCVDEIKVYKNKNAVSKLVATRESSIKDIDKVLSLIDKLGSSSEVPLIHYSYGKYDCYKILFEVTTRYLAKTNSELCFYIAKSPSGEIMILGDRRSDTFKSLNNARLLNWEKSKRVIMPWRVLEFSNSSNTTVAITEYRKTSEYQFIDCYKAFDKNMPTYDIPVSMTTNEKTIKTDILNTIKAEPVKAEPVKAEPVKAEPVKAEPVVIETATNENKEDTKKMNTIASTIDNKVAEIKEEVSASINLGSAEYVRLYKFISKVNPDKICELISGVFKENTLTSSDINKLFKSLTLDESNEETLGKMMAYTLEQRGELSSLMNVINMLS